MKDRVIETITIIIVVIAIIITFFFLNMNNLNFVEMGNYALVAGNNDLILTKEEKIELLKNKQIAYVDYVNKKLTIKTGVVKDINFTNNEKILTVINNKNTKIDSSCVIGNSLVIIPGLGYIINYLLTRDGFLLFIVLPLLIVCIYELFKFIDGIQNIKHKY